VRAGIARQLSLGLAAVQVVALGTVAVLVTSRMEGVLVSEVGEAAVASVDALEALLREDMLVGRRDDLRRGVEAIRQRANVRGVRVLDGRGVVAVSSEPDDEGQQRPRDGPTCRSCHPASAGPDAGAAPAQFEELESSRTLRAVKPVFNGPGCVGSCHVHRPEQRVLGFLEIDGSLERVDETIARTRWIIAGFTLAAVVLTILASRALVVRWIHRPVRDLVEATGRLAAGDLTWRVPAQRDRDFGRIASAFDRMAAGLEQAQRQVILSAKLASAGKLAAGVAHELNNPLTGILAFAEDLLAHAAPDDRRRADYEVIVRETRRCGDIVRDLLDFARQEMPEQRECDLHDIIGRAVALVERLVGFRRVRIERRFDPSLPRVLADSGQLQQVFLNLLTNAAEAMPDGGTITLATRPVAGGLVEASVADTGPGIPPEIRERIFEPFFSTKRSAAGHPSGQGLGLAVSWSIVERHRGKMSVESVVGGGTTFRVVFPAVGERGAGKP